MDKVENLIKVKLEDEEVLKMTREQMTDCWHRQAKFSLFLEQFAKASETDLKLCEHSVNEAIQKAENDLKLSKSGQCSSGSGVFVPPIETRGSLVDPCVNILVHKLQSDIRERENRIDNVTAELNAWKLTSSDGCSVDEKRAMAKCRMLSYENSVLGDQMSESRLSHIKAEVDEHRTATELLLHDIKASDELSTELDCDLASLQGTLMLLYQALRTKGKATPDLVAALESAPTPKTNPVLKSKSATLSKSSNSASCNVSTSISGASNGCDDQVKAKDRPKKSSKSSSGDNGPVPKKPKKSPSTDSLTSNSATEGASKKPTSSKLSNGVCNDYEMHSDEHGCGVSANGSDVHMDFDSQPKIEDKPEVMSNEVNKVVNGIAENGSKCERESDEEPSKNCPLKMTTSQHSTLLERTPPVVSNSLFH